MRVYRRFHNHSRAEERNRKELLERHNTSRRRRRPSPRLPPSKTNVRTVSIAESGAAAAKKVRELNLGGRDGGPQQQRKTPPGMETKVESSSVKFRVIIMQMEGRRGNLVMTAGQLRCRQGEEEEEGEEEEGFCTKSIERLILAAERKHQLHTARVF